MLDLCFGLQGRLPDFIDNEINKGQEEGFHKEALDMLLFLHQGEIIRPLKPGVDCSLCVRDFLIY